MHFFKESVQATDYSQIPQSIALKMSCHVYQVYTFSVINAQKETIHTQIELSVF